jgi:hypothetical protein
MQRVYESTKYGVLRIGEVVRFTNHRFTATSQLEVNAIEGSKLFRKTVHYLYDLDEAIDEPPDHEEKVIAPPPEQDKPPIEERAAQHRAEAGVKVTHQAAMECSRLGIDPYEVARYLKLGAVKKEHIEEYLARQLMEAGGDKNPQ